MRHFYTVIFLFVVLGCLGAVRADENPALIESAVPLSAPQTGGEKVWSSLDNREVMADAVPVVQAAKLEHPAPAVSVSNLASPGASGAEPSAASVTPAAPGADAALSTAPAVQPSAEPVKPMVAAQPAAEPLKTPQNLMAEVPYVDARSEVQSIGAHIYDVKGIGSWQRQGMSGQVRMIITRNSRRDDVYLQWVAWRDGSPKAIIASDAVSEINNDANYQVRAISSQILQGKPQITLSLEDKYSKEMLRGIIRVIDVGVFECQVLR